MKDSIAILLKRYSEDSNNEQAATPTGNTKQAAEPQQDATQKTEEKPAEQKTEEKPAEQKQGDHKALEDELAKCDGMTDITADSLKAIMAAVKADAAYFKDHNAQVAVFKQLAAAQKQLASAATAGDTTKTDNGGTTPDPNSKTTGDTGTSSTTAAPLDKNVVARTTTGFNLLKQTFGNLNIPKEQWVNYLNNYIKTMM